MTREELLNMCAAMAQHGQGLRAAQMLEHAARARPDDADIAHHLGLTLLGLSGRAEEALGHLRRSIQMARGDSEYRCNYGLALEKLGRHEEAAAVLRDAAELSPYLAAAHLGLSAALISLRGYTDAIEAARRAAEVAPGDADAPANLSIALLRCGRATEAIAVLEEALGRMPDRPSLLLQYAANLHFTDAEPGAIRAAHERLGRVLGGAAPTPKPFENPRDTERPLRIGYLSPDFREHSVAHFARALLGGPTGGLSAYAYSLTPAPDAVTAELRGLGAKWRDMATLTEAGLEAQVRGDRIDILVDLAGHTAGSRIAAMARRMAPVQATYLGYAATTGIGAIDYRIVDSLTDPPGAEPHSTERLARLDPCFLCYRPPGNLPEYQGGVRGERGGAFTFASFNAAPKIGEGVVRAWAAILGAVPGSRLIVRSTDDGEADDALRTRFGGHGVDPERVETAPFSREPREHLDRYRTVDLALDTFPYHGTTTTCEALVMGVPVVTLAGRTHAGRVGVSLLSAVGLPELIADDAAGYVALGAALARDTDRLSRLRTGLRERVLASPLCDAPAFIARLVRAYREMWRTWCATGIPPRTSSGSR